MPKKEAPLEGGEIIGVLKKEGRNRIPSFRNGRIHPWKKGKNKTCRLYVWCGVGLGKEAETEIRVLCLFCL